MLILVQTDAQVMRELLSEALHYQRKEFHSYLYSMVVYNPRAWFGLIFSIHKGETFQKLLWVMISLVVYTWIITYVEIEILMLQYTSTTIVHSLLGFVISLLLVFRTNTAYERWWEGRKQWGALVNVSRNLSLKIESLIPDEQKKLKQELYLCVAAYSNILKDHLRMQSPEVLTPFLPAFLKLPAGHKHLPNFLAREMQKRIKTAYGQKLIGEAAYLAMLEDLGKFTDIMGACERIKKTPIPYTYNIFIKKFIFIYTITVPFGFVSDFGYWTIPITVFIFYTFASLELIAEEIEDPFGLDSNDLPTNEIAETIALNVQEIMTLNEDNEKSATL